MSLRRPAVSLVLAAFLSASCMRIFRDPVGETFMFQGTEYFAHGAAGLRISQDELMLIGTVPLGPGTAAADGQVFRLKGVDDSRAVVMRAAPGFGMDYLLLTAGALPNARYDAVPGLCEHVVEEDKGTVGC